ncbi:MAG TPA: SAM-dependent methyltransferase, partial [Terriglobales bacterium]|nr:SAM-dependent methyltransferase [Terriglobales bacterium]
HRRIASSLVFLTGHHAENANPDYWPDAIAPNTTVVVYMPGRNYDATAQKLRAAGVAPETPCAIVSQIGSPSERMCKTTIAELASTAALPAPSLLVVGDVVRFAQHRSRGEQFSQFVADRLEALQGTRTQEQAL